jgi:hypothetical protein
MAIPLEPNEQDGMLEACRLELTPTLKLLATVDEQALHSHRPRSVFMGSFDEQPRACASHGE